MDLREAARLLDLFVEIDGGENLPRDVSNLVERLRTLALALEMK